MRRGEIWTVSASGYAGKPRPAIIIQSDAFDQLPTVTICALTTDPTELRIVRFTLQPSAGNGLLQPCKVMVDKLSTVPTSKLGRRIGALDEPDMARLNETIALFLGLA